MAVLAPPPLASGSSHPKKKDISSDDGFKTRKVKNAPSRKFYQIVLATSTFIHLLRLHIPVVSFLSAEASGGDAVERSRGADENRLPEVRQTSNNPDTID
jgi:hypothetical protein